MTNAYHNIKTLIPKIEPSDPFRSAWASIAGINDFHPAVFNVLKKHEPDSWVDLLFEYPHASADGQRVAYLSEKRSLKRDGSVVTIVVNTPRYLARHFPKLKDHELRDLATYTDGCSYKLLDDIHEIIYVIDNGPWSCMQSSYRHGWVQPRQHSAYKSSGTKFDVSVHPYAAYCPSLGWRLAVRYTEDGQIAARALVFDSIFVRSYQQDGPSGNKHDPQLEAWMESQGFTEQGGWDEGTPLYRRKHMLFPYIDGDMQHVDDDLEITTVRGGYSCDNTNGEADGYRGGGGCGDCGDHMDEDESYYVEDRGHNVCYCCIDNYTYIERSGDYIDNDNVGVVGETCFDTRCTLPDHIVLLESGDYADIDDCVCIDDEWYRHNDRQVVELEEEHEGDRYGLTRDCWCDQEGSWFHDDVESIEIGSSLYRLDECETDDITGDYYVPGTEMIELPCGKTVHPDSEAVKQLELT